MGYGNDGMYEYLPGRKLTPEEAEKALREGREILEHGLPDEEGCGEAPRTEGLPCSVCGGNYDAPRKGDAEYICIKCALDVPARDRVCAICGRRVTDHYVADGLRLCHKCAEEVV